MLSLIGVVVLLWSAVRSPLVQTQIADYLTATLGKMLNTKVSIGKARYYINQGLTLQNVLVFDQNGDTLVYVPQLSGYLNSVNIDEKSIDIRRAYLRGMKAFVTKTDSSDNFGFIADAFGKKDTVKSNWTIGLDEITIVQTNICLDDGRKKHNFCDFDIDISDFSVRNDSISANVETLTSGYNGKRLVDDLRFKFCVSDGKINIDDLNFEGRRSQAQMNSIVVKTDKSGKGPKVSYGVNVNNMQLCPDDFSALLPQLEGNRKRMSLTGVVSGTESNLNGNNIKVQMLDSTLLKCNFALEGINNIDNLGYSFTVGQFKTNSADLLALASYFAKADTMKMKPLVTPLDKVEFSGYAEGTTRDVSAEGSLLTGIGDLELQASLGKTGDKVFGVVANLKSSPIAIGKLTNSDASLQVDLKANGTIGKADATSLVLVGSVNDIAYSGHTIDSVSIDGLVEMNKFSGRLCSFDRNLRFDFDGLVDWRDSAVFQFQSYVYYANLYALGLSKKEDANMSFNINADFRNASLDMAEGSVNVSDIYYFSDSTYFATDSVSIFAFNTDTGKVVTLKSEFVSVEVDAPFGFADIVKDISGYAGRLATGKDYSPTGNNGTIAFRALADYPRPLTEKFAPWLNISSGTELTAFFIDSINFLDLNLKSDNVLAQDFEIDNLSIGMKGSGDSVRTTLTSDCIYFVDFQLMDSLQVSSTLADGFASLLVNWDNHLAKGRNSGCVNADISLSNPNQKEISIKESSITIFDTTATIRPSTVILRDTATVFSNVDIDNGMSRIFVNGMISDYPDDSLVIGIGKLRLDFLSEIFALKTSLTGSLSGNVNLKDLKGEKRIEGGLGIADFSINGQRFGNVDANASWDMEQRQLLVGGALSDNGGSSRTTFAGFIDPANSYMNLDAEATHQDVQFLKLFLSNVFSEMVGTFSGKMHLDGRLTSPNWYGKMGLEDTYLTLKPTKAVYYTNDTLEFIENKIRLNKVKLTDTEAGNFTIDGSIWHRDMKEFNIDLKFDCNNIVALNIRNTDSPLWYGKTYASGIVDVTGSTRKAINVDISATTMPKSMFYITMEGRNDLTENEFITFVQPANIANINDAKRKRTEQVVEAPRSTLSLNLDLKVTPDAEVQIVFDPTIGDALRSSGNADLNIRLVDNNFSIYGTYLINRGDFTFTLQNIISKKLDLQSGSYVTWTGEPLGATVNIDAAYKLRKVPVYSLTLNEEDREKKVPVNCHLLMSNKLVSPNISFSIDVPSTTSNVEEIEQLNSLPTDDLNQQVVYLLLLNKFYPLTTVASNDASSSAASVSASTASELLSNQLSKWISQISTNFDLGVAYRPETEISSEEYELTLSTSLWDDRIVVNSNFDVNSQEKSSENGTNQYTTDFSVELKLNKKGNVRLKAFQKVNEDLIYDDAPYTRGLGLFFTEDFNEFSDLRKRWFRRKEKTPAETQE